MAGGQSKLPCGVHSQALSLETMEKGGDCPRLPSDPPKVSRRRGFHLPVSWVWAPDHPRAALSPAWLGSCSACPTGRLLHVICSMLPRGRSSGHARGCLGHSRTRTTYWWPPLPHRGLAPGERDRSPLPAGPLGSAWPGRKQEPSLAPGRRLSRGRNPLLASVSPSTKWTGGFYLAPPLRSATEARTDSAPSRGSECASAEAGGARPGAGRSPCPGTPAPSQESARACCSRGGRGHGQTRLVPQRSPRQQALTWPPSEPPSCGSETNAWLGAVASPRPPRVRRRAGGPGPGGGRRGPARATHALPTAAAEGG